MSFTDDRPGCASANCHRLSYNTVRYTPTDTVLLVCEDCHQELSARSDWTEY